MRIVFLLFLIIHGLIHLMGFAKSFDLGNVTQISKEIPKPLGIIWLSTFLLFMISAVLFFLKKEEWLLIGIISIVISQILVICEWQDAKFGTIANLIIALVAILNIGSLRFEKSYRNDIRVNQTRTAYLKNELLSEKDLINLPEPIQRYLHYVGVVNKPKVNSVRIVFEGLMRERGKDYFPFTTEQFNYFDEPTRLFFMKGKMFGLVVPGYHKYSNGKATMEISLFGLIPIVKESGFDLDKAETVTLFNDMCLLAPATLIDKRIKWESINDTAVKAIFTNMNITISAVLFINKQGQLFDFLSNDRIAISDKKQYPFSTPIKDYKNINGFNLMSSGEVVWHYPDGNFSYGKFKLKDIVYNSK